MTNNEIKQNLIQHLESKLEPEFKYIKYMMHVGNASIFDEVELTTNIIKSMYLFNGKITFNTMNILLNGEVYDIISSMRQDSDPKKALLTSENAIDLFIESELESLFKFENETDQTVWEEAKNVFIAKFEALEAERIAFEEHCKAEREDARKEYEERLKQQSPEEIEARKVMQETEDVISRAESIAEGEEGYVTNEELGKAMRAILRTPSPAMIEGSPAAGLATADGIDLDALNPEFFKPLS